MFFSRKKKRLSAREIGASYDEDRQDEARSHGQVRPTLAQDHEIWNQPGPRSAAEVDTSVGYVDMGSLRIPVVPGMQVQTQMSEDKKNILGVFLVLGNSGLLITVAAAPRSGGVWDELRSQMRDGLQADGATVDEVEGRYGVELHVAAPVAGPDGAKHTSYTRIIGCEGDRWFARLSVVGPAAIDEAVGADVEKVIDRLVVVRDEKPRARLDVLPLSLPAARNA
ncbi:DUF3710 domain-containing protein [Schaalia suimastitidis]|uniref:DUF3710 domain-containing protein n=1 Tax=Schaalia suimastitidis TaxID=121163 RepID=UPI000406CCF5|nr:DUF3710 domain-containing protein [Schaalia suimastitidis]